MGPTEVRGRVIHASLLLEARGVGRQAADTGAWLLRDISLRLAPGERLGLLGPSGAGKSLLLRALALLDPLDEGTVLWQGQSVADASVPTFRRQALYLPQRPALFEGSVEANLRLPFTLKAQRGHRFDRVRILALLAELGRDETFLARSQRDLSGGEAQIVALLRAIQLAPVVLLLDEPTAALDPSAAAAIEKLVAFWQGERPGARACLWVSHDVAQTERVVGRRLYLSHGRLAEKG